MSGGGGKFVYKRAISSSHRMKLAKLETEILMESFDKPSISNWTWSCKNDLQNENKLQNKNELQHENELQNKNELQNENELIHENELQNENFISDNDTISESEISDYNIRILQDFTNNVTESNDSNNESDQNIDFKKFLANWTVTECISHSSLRLLLKGIKQYTCQNCSFDIPTDPRNLVNTPRNTDTDVCGNGYYYHFGLTKSILNAISSISRNITNIKISINIDGLPLSKSSQRQFWDLQLILKNFSSSAFIMAQKNQLIQINFLKNLWMKQNYVLCKEGIIINNKNIPCIIDSIICDAQKHLY